MRANLAAKAEKQKRKAAPVLFQLSAFGLPLSPLS
jgi:hypothetical protein